ncbi:unnamed protein product [Allacma fusca]|uniref:C2H2-type domain-containing protein n=1 Tax=Allacma fusca TaxID=39272 RepID=A0A8J2JUH4_9HEXA|nr:unnamed protein product [Allacma fusca]
MKSNTFNQNSFLSQSYLRTDASFYSEYRFKQEDQPNNTQSYYNSSNNKQYPKNSQQNDYSYPFGKSCFPSVADLKNHFNVHLDPERGCLTTAPAGFPKPKTSYNRNQFECKICRQTFSTRDYLQMHLQTHSEKERANTCSYCCKFFASKNYLKVHLRVHTGEKPFTCEICQHAFNQKSTLNTHLRTHSEEKPYACEFCNKAFTAKEYLKVHVRIHTGEKPFTCKTCVLKNYGCAESLVSDSKASSAGRKGDVIADQEAQKETAEFACAMTSELGDSLESMAIHGIRLYKPKLIPKLDVRFVSDLMLSASNDGLW